MSVSLISTDAVRPSVLRKPLASVTAPGTTTAGIDAFMAYKVKLGTGATRFVAVSLPLADRFGSGAYRLVKPKQLALPSDVNGAGTIDPATHLLEYQVKLERGEPPLGVRRDVETSTACGAVRLELSKPGGLAG